MRIRRHEARSSVRWAMVAWFGLACVGADAADRGIEYQPPAEAERLQPSAVQGGSELGLIVDFDLAGDTLYLLDRLSGVVVVERGAAGWRVTRSIGRSGSGPGEFVGPSGLAITNGRLVVADATRLQFLTPAGDVAASKPLVLPCVMLRPGVAAARQGVFVHGSCVRSSYTTDTVKSVLLWTADTVTYAVVAEDVRYTKDGRMGSAFGAWNGFTGGPAGRHLFGSGTRNCIFEVRDNGAVPDARPLCPAAVTLYAADPPAHIAERIKSPVAGVRVTWPPHLAVFVERMQVDDQAVLVRPYSADSVVFQMLAPREDVLAVAPLDGLIGCRPAGCLWVLEEEVPRLIVLGIDDLRRRVSAGARN